MVTSCFLFGYRVKIMKVRSKNTLSYSTEQEIGRNGRVMVRVSNKEDNCVVEITGNAVFVKEFDVLLEK